MRIEIVHIIDAWSVAKAMVFVVAAGSIAYPASEMVERRVREGWIWFVTRFRK